MKQQGNNRKRSPLLIALGVLVLLCVPGLDQRMIVRRYTLETEKLTQPVRIVQVSDLHSCRYGAEMQTLIEAVAAQEPDVLVLTGDIFDDVRSDECTEQFLAGISGNYPCYYVTGNHEFWLGEAVYAQKMEILGRYEVTRLAGRSEVLAVRGQELQLCGVDDPESYVVDARHSYAEQMQEVAPDGAHYSVLLSHRPDLFADYVEKGYGLALSGHAHGGQWRIPLLLNGLYAPDQGLFPKLAGGCYQDGSTTMIVSRGLARETTKVPRIYNRPELVVIDLLPQG